MEGNLTLIPNTALDNDGNSGHELALDYDDNQDI